MAKKAWIVEYLDGSNKKTMRTAAEDAEGASYKVLERFPHAIIKNVREAGPDEKPGAPKQV